MACLVERSFAAARLDGNRRSSHQKPALRLIVSAGGCGWMVESCSYAVRIKYRIMHRTRVRRAFGLRC